MFHLENGDLIEVEREEFCRWYEPQNKDPELVWNFEIHTVDVTGDAAQVKIKSRESEGLIYRLSQSDENLRKMVDRP